MPLPITANISLTQGAWTDCGYVMAPAEQQYFVGGGTGHTGSNTGNTVCTPAGATPVNLPLVGDAAAYGYYAAWASATVSAAGRYALTVAVKQDGTGPPDTFPRSSGPSPIAYGFCPGSGVGYSYTNPNLVNCRIWAVFNAEGNFYGEMTGGPFTLTITSQLFTLSSPTVSACQRCCTNTVVVSWTQVFTSGIPDNQPAQSYTVYRQVDGTGGYVQVATCLQNDTLVYIDTNVSEGNTYQYHVTATYSTTTSDPGSASVAVTGWGGIILPNSAYSGVVIPASAWRGRDCGCD